MIALLAYKLQAVANMDVAYLWWLVNGVISIVARAKLFIEMDTR